MQIYSKSMKNATSLSFLGRFWLFVLSDRAWCGLQNFYTEFWNSLIMQIYSISMKNATSLSFLGRFWFSLFYLIGLGAGFKTSTKNFEIHYANLCKFIQNQWKMPPLLSPLFRNHNRSALEAGKYITHRVIYYPLVCFIFIYWFVYINLCIYAFVDLFDILNHW